MLHEVATLSYERALQMHARYRTANDDSSAQPSYPTSGARSGEIARHGAQLARPGDFPAEPVGSFTSIGAHDRKCASITIRMSKAECEQLKRRAAEAGLTISAYLRSCTFEAEALRAQVKDALAELRKVNAPAGVIPYETDTQTPSGDTVKGARLSWLRRLVPDLHHSRQLSRA